MRLNATIYFYKIGNKEPRVFFSGYRPAFKFKGSREFNSGRLIFKDRNQATEGEEIEGEVHFLKPERVKKYLKPGVTFEFYEGSKLLGKCTIVKTFNS